MSTEQSVTRVDRYTIDVGGQRVRATPDQESRIRVMTPEQRGMFITAMGLAALAPTADEGGAR
jgi:hypothetical protein